MKILLVCDWFLKLVVPNQARALVNLGHEVRVLTRDHAYEFDGDYAERRETMDAADLDFIELPGKRFSPLSIGAVARVRRDVRDWAPDVVSAHENADPRLLAIASTAPIAYTIHDPEPHPESNVDNRRALLTFRLWEKASSAIVIHSDLLRDQLRSKLSDDKRVRVIPHGVDIAPTPLPVPDSETILLFGRLEAYKGAPVLVEAMRILWQTRPNARLIVAGRGPAAANIPEDPRIELISRYITEAEVTHLLSRTRVSVLPYIQASQSGVGLLSLAQGIPTVVTNTGGLPDLAFRGLPAVPPEDAPALAAALSTALDMGASDRVKIHQFASDRFSWANVAKGYVKVYEQIAGDRRG